MTTRVRSEIIDAFGRGRLITASFIALLASGDATAPPLIGQQYVLTHINGQPLPFTFRTASDSLPPAVIVYGSVILLNDSIAERRERISDSSSPSVLPISDWTYGGRYYQLPGRIVLRYFPPVPAPGPRQPVETLLVSARGLTLREIGITPPLDSLIRLFCTSALPS